jgi:hypothetical protein
MVADLAGFVNGSIGQLSDVRDNDSLATIVTTLIENKYG